MAFKEVKIGSQVWMAENLAIDDGREGIYHNNDNGEFCYTWNAAMRIAKSIPGWHLPSVGEWSEAVWACDAAENGSESTSNYYDAAQLLKDKLDVKLTGGYAYGGFYDEGSNGCFWTSSESNPQSARRLCFGKDTSNSFVRSKSLGYSVRLIKEN